MMAILEDFFSALASAPPASTGARDPAALRFNNPGAMYPGPSASRFGSTGFATIGGGHKIAIFPDAVSGASAQFDLLNRGYAGMPLAEAIRKWSGGHSSPAYTAAIAKATGLAPETVLTQDMLRDPALAVPLARAAARWEAGRDFPLTDAQWREAHARVFGAATPQPPDGMDARTYAPASPPLAAESAPPPRNAGTVFGALSGREPQDTGTVFGALGDREGDPSADPLRGLRDDDTPLRMPQQQAAALPKLDLSRLRALMQGRGLLGTMRT